MADITITDAKTDATTDAPAVPEIVFPVYMIYSKWSLVQMDRHLEHYGGAGFLRIVFGRDDQETDRTIAIMSSETYDALCADGYGDEKKEDRSYGRGFRVGVFKLNDGSYPGEGRNKTLFIPVPKVLGNEDTWVIDTITEKLQHLAEWGIVPKDSWSLNVPLKSREEGGVRGGCFVSFKREVELARIAMARILLTDTYWPEVEAPEATDEKEKRSVFRCHWARDRPQGGKDRERTGKRGDARDGAPSEDAQKAKEDKKRHAIQKMVKHARPVAKKAPTVPVVAQPVLAEKVPESKA